MNTYRIVSFVAALLITVGQIAVFASNTAAFA